MVFLFLHSTSFFASRINYDCLFFCQLLVVVLVLARYLDLGGGMVLRRYHFCGTDSFRAMLPIGRPVLFITYSASLYESIVVIPSSVTTLPCAHLVLFIIYSASLRESIVVIPSSVTTLPCNRLVLFIIYSASLRESIVVIHSKKALDGFVQCL